MIALRKESAQLNQTKQREDEDYTFVILAISIALASVGHILSAPTALYKLVGSFSDKIKTRKTRSVKQQNPEGFGYKIITCFFVFVA